MTEENNLRRFQRAVRHAYRRGKHHVAESEELDAAKEIAKEAASRVTSEISKAKHSYDTSAFAKMINPVAGKTTEIASDLASDALDLARDINDKYDLGGKASSAARTVADPISETLKKSGATAALTKAGNYGATGYDQARQYAKPYFEAETERELLENTRHELLRVNACIQQVSIDEADAWAARFGKALTSKLAGVAGSATVFGLVASLGTASTGTAIASLSGAAANSAVLFKVGSVFGGGMATGGLVLGGVGLVVGVGTYKLLSSTAREYEDMPESDQRIVSTCATLIAAIDEKLIDENVELTGYEARQLLSEGFEPLLDHLEGNADDICSRLDSKNAFSFRYHVLQDFPKVVNRDFEHYSASPQLGLEAVIGGIIYALLTDSVVPDDPESQLVLEAIRRGNTELENASEAEISHYLAEMSPEQLRGLANNVKGIYHEMMWVDEYNRTHTESFAIMPEATNNPGADVLIVSRDTGDVIQQIQLKATSEPSYVAEHLSRYPNIDIAATTEATGATNVADSGFSNTELTKNTDRILDNLADNTLADRVTESAEIASLVSAGREAIELLRGNAEVSESAKRVIGTVVQTAAATGITAYLFS